MNFKKEIDSIIARDPAARNIFEVILCYPSFHVMIFYRLHHWLWDIWSLRLIPRFISQFARFITGIEIHPGAKIGEGFFIDHGAGVVIGETAVIGDNVTIYHGVTLGGVSPSENSNEQRNQKRHPTLEDNVIIGSGAQIIGPITISAYARVGANAVVVKNVLKNQTVVGIPARVIGLNIGNFIPYATFLSGDDPILKEIESLRNELAELKSSINLSVKKTTKVKSKTVVKKG